MIVTVVDPLVMAPEDPVYASLDNHSGSVACDSSGATEGEQYVETHVSMYKGGEKQSLSSIVCKIQGVTLGTDYTPDVPAPTRNYKKATTLNTGYVKIIVKDGTLLISESVVITATAVIDGESVSKDMTLTISGSKAGVTLERYWIEFQSSTGEVRINEGFAGEKTFTPSSDTLLLKHLKGSTEESLSTIPSGYTLQYRPSGGSWQNITPGTRTFSTDSSDGAASLVEYRLRKGNTVLSQISIHTRWEYQRMLLPAGVYTSKEYTRTSTTTPLVLHEASGEYWYLVADTNKVGNTIYGPKDANQQYWKQAEDYEVILTKILFAQFAQLGGFIVVGNFFISRYGTLYRYENGAVRKYNEGGSGLYQYFDADDPMVEVMPDAQHINKWRPALCVDARYGEAWYAGGNVHFSREGRVTMNEAVVKGATMIDHVEVLKGKAYDLHQNSYPTGKEIVYYLYDVTKGEDYSLVSPDYEDYYGIGSISLKCSRLFVCAEGILNAPNGSEGTTANSKLRIVLPPPHRFIGQSIIITNRSFGFPVGNVILEQAYEHEVGSDWVCFTDKNLLPCSPDYPYGEYLPIEAAPYDINEFGLYLLNGIWSLSEGDWQGYHHIMLVVEPYISLDDYEWIELTAAEGEYKKEVLNAEVPEALPYNAVWMITRCERKQANE